MLSIWFCVAALLNLPKVSATTRRRSVPQPRQGGEE